VVGGLLLTQRPSQAETPGATPTAASPDGPASAAPAGDLSPRAADGDHSATDPAVPSPEAVALGLPGELSLAELFPSEVAMGAVSAEAAGPSDAGAAGAAVSAGQVGGDSGGGSGSRWPLIAGMVVTLVILVCGGGWLWWRNRESAYWPA